MTHGTSKLERQHRSFFERLESGLVFTNFACPGRGFIARDSSRDPSKECDSPGFPTQQVRQQVFRRRMRTATGTAPAMNGDGKRDDSAAWHLRRLRWQQRRTLGLTAMATAATMAVCNDCSGHGHDCWNEGCYRTGRVTTNSNLLDGTGWLLPSIPSSRHSIHSVHSILENGMVFIDFSCPGRAQAGGVG